jgi:glycosyltransferase involved in cell wall biosynthesis
VTANPASYHAAAGSNGAGSPLIGYLTSEYPSPSHTFIRREIASLRGAGMGRGKSTGTGIKTYSVRAPGHVIDNALEREASDETFFILQRGKFAIVGDLLRAFALRPLRFFKTLKLALGHRVPGVKALLWALFYFTEAMVLVRQLKRDQVTHLHNHFANPAANVGMFAAHFLDIPWSLTLHGISEFDYPAGNLLPEKLKFARFAACVSHFGRAQAMRMVPPEIWPRLHLVRCGIDLEDLPKTQPAPKTRSANEPLQLICVGRISPEKGHAGLIEALGNLRAKGTAITLTLVGDGPQMEQLRSLVNASGLSEAVIFKGRLDERSTLEAIAQSDILVLPSFMEGLPIVLMEALALGVPAVATRVAGIPELIVDGETGLLFDPGHWADLEKALARVCAHKDLREVLAKAGRAKIESEFAYPAAAAPLAALFAGDADAHRGKAGEPE